MSIFHKTFSNLFSRELHSLIEENNIIGKYDENNIVTTDENFLSIIEVEGLSYLGLSDDEMEEYIKIRNTFFKQADQLFSISIFMKRQEANYNTKTITSNSYANEIIEKWNSNINTSSFETKYYIAISTRKKSIKSILLKRKESMTTNAKVNTLNYNNDKLNDMVKKVLLSLEKFKPRRLNSDEVISFFASYMNMFETKIKTKTGLLEDSYINTNLKFDRNFMTHEKGECKKYSLFLSVKSYDCEHIDSNMTNDILALSNEIMICQQINQISKEKAESKINDKIHLSSELVQEELEELKELIKTDREVLLNYSLSVLLTCNSHEELQDLQKEVENILNNRYSLISTVENINLRTLYFSYFPSRDNINARKRYQPSSVVAVLNPFEQDFKGYEKSEFGKEEICLFQTSNKSTFKFNYHNSIRPKALGHLLVIAPSESGKTTLQSFLEANCLKYDINILNYDKLHGMYVMTEYLDGSYEDLNDSFSLNPFSLEDTEENKAFLKNFLCLIGEIGNEDYDEVVAIQETLERIYQHKDDENITLTDFINSLPKIEKLENRFLPYKNSIFDNEQCSLNFEKKITTLGMDTILKDDKSASLVLFYINHKMKITAQAKGIPFLTFIDELKDYLHNETSAKYILESMLESRKIGGSNIVAVQNLDFFDLIENKSSFLNGFAHYIVFPTTSETVLSNLKKELALTENELDFLEKTDPSEYKVLFKNRKDKSSIVLDINLSSLGKYLNVFNSDSNKVSEVRKMKNNFGTNWREEYLNDSNR